MSFNRKKSAFIEKQIRVLENFTHKRCTKYSNERTGRETGVKGRASLKLTKHLCWTLFRGRLATVRKALKSCGCCRRNVVNELHVSSLPYLPSSLEPPFVHSSSKTSAGYSHKRRNLIAVQIREEYEHEKQM